MKNTKFSRPKVKPTKKHLKRLFGLAWPYKGRLSLGLFAMFVTTICMLAVPQYLRKVFDEALEAGNIQALHGIIAILMLTVVVLVIGIFVRTYFLQYTASVIISQLRGRIFSHIIKLDLEFFEERSAGEIISRLLSDITIIREFIQFGSPMLIRGFFLAIGSLSALFLTNAKLTLMVAGFGIPIILVAGILGKKWRAYSKSIQDNFVKLSEIVEQSIGGIRTVKAFAQENSEIKNYNTYRIKTLRLAKKLIVSSGGFFAFNILVGFSAIILVIWLGGREVILGEISLGEMMAYLLYLAFLGDGVASLARFWPSLQNAAGATERAFDLLAEKPKMLETKNPKALPKAKNGRNIKFKNISFAYSSRPNELALNGFSLDINAGETVAIVGPSGAGKSTLFALLMRFYEVQKGKILLDNVDTKELKFEDLRGALAMVAQDSTIFSTTIAENIAYGKPNASMEEIKQSAKVAYAEGFIKDLPQTYNTKVGEKGVRLSGGQKQRIAIARTVLRNPDVLLLDEATSSLDAESEREVQKSITKLQKGRTTIVIAHRLATVKSADKIVVLEKGKKLAEGTHTKLIKTCALYRNLAKLQFIN